MNSAGFAQCMSSGTPSASNLSILASRSLDKVSDVLDSILLEYRVTERRQRPWVDNSMATFFCTTGAIWFRRLIMRQPLR
jgi:hypothetical protein